MQYRMLRTPICYNGSLHRFTSMRHPVVVPKAAPSRNGLPDHPVMTDYEADVAAIQAIDVIPTILDVVCRTTGMGFAAVARVTEDRWIACEVRDDIQFGLKPGGELKVETTICHEVRQAREAVIIDHVAEDPQYCAHHTPKMYGIQSYISMPIVLRDGTFFGTLCAIDPKPAKLKDPAIVGMFEMFADLIALHLHVNDKLVASVEVRRSSEFVNGILASSPDGIRVLSTEGIVEFINDRGAELDELPNADAAIGQDFVATWPEVMRDEVRDGIARALMGEVVRIDGYRPTAKGLPRCWGVSLTAFRPKGFDVKIVCVSRDVTARVEAEAEKRDALEALAELNESLERRVIERNEELKGAQDALRQSQKMEAVGQLTGGLAHDFNNLLTGITGNLELMRRRITEQRPINELDRHITAAQGAAKRAAALTHRLLAFSRRQTLDPKPTDVSKLIADMDLLIRQSVGPAIEIDVVAPSDLWPVLIDPNQLENAVLNLAINARDAMPKGGSITLEMINSLLDERAAREHDVTPGPYLALRVTDTGSGMPQEVIDRAFDPFFTTKPIGEGTGLGLSMIYGFARQSGGQVHIYSEIDRGTTVSLYLPRYSGDLEVGETADALQAASSERSETILIVDDEATVRGLVMEVLADFGYVGIEASDGAAGLRILQSSRRIDLLVTDVGLPGGMNGRQLADAAQVGRPDLKVLFITGYAERTVVGNGYLAKGTEILTKPFTIDALAHRVQALLAR
jgi:signal transduction histidine kinase